jgi:hypothetical protein
VTISKIPKTSFSSSRKTTIISPAQVREPERTLEDIQANIRVINLTLAIILLRGELALQSQRKRAINSL